MDKTQIKRIIDQYQEVNFSKILLWKREKLHDIIMATRVEVTVRLQHDR